MRMNALRTGGGTERKKNREQITVYIPVKLI